MKYEERERERYNECRTLTSKLNDKAAANLQLTGRLVEAVCTNNHLTNEV
jgi:hypothetical protein